MSDLGNKNTNDNNTFEYTYSAKDRDEVKKIREKYAPAAEREESAIERLRRLDAGVTKKATAFSLIVGVIGALILGIGMSLVMTELGDFLGLPVSLTLFVGVLIGAVGIVFVALAYPIYQHTVKKERARIAPEILRLTDDLMK